MDAFETPNTKWEELDVTKEELENLNECLKKEEFRKLFIEYASEVTSEENRKLYQREITQLEKERGVDVTFVNSEPGYVIKTTLNGDKKCFINIGKSGIVEKPTSQPSYEEGNRGLQWSIPYTLSPPHDDLDKKNNRCTVFDVVFHPDTLYLASKNSRFRDVVNSTALDGVENNFKVSLDRKNIKFPKMQFKGTKHSSVIRKKCEKPVESTMDTESEIYQKLMSNYDEAREKYANSFMGNKKSRRPSPVRKYFDVKSNLLQSNDKEYSNYTTPKFVVKHQTDFDIQDYRNSKDSRMFAAIPKNLIILVDLPLIKSAADAELDVQERVLTVISKKPAKYHLELPLPYRVDPNNGNAKFDSIKKKLTITLPVIRDNIKELLEFKDDSGVESDHGSPQYDMVNQLNENNENYHFEVENDLRNRNLSSSINDENEKLPSDSLINEIEFLNGDDNEHDDKTALQNINSSVIYDDAFMNDNILYSLPNYTSTIFRDILTLTIHIKNVDSGSIKHKLLENNSGIHITLSSVGAGFFPIYYSLCFKIQDDTFDRDTVTVEPWDNNIVFTVGLKNINGLSYYTVGLNEDFMEQKDLPIKISMDDELEYQYDDSNENKNIELNQNQCESKIEVLNNDEVEFSISSNSNNMDSDDGDFDGDYETRNQHKVNKHKKKVEKFRSISESSGDELPNSNGSNGSSIITRGILKYRRNNFSRSVSESSIDDTAGLMSSIDLNYDSVHELNSESDCSSLKKTVRFNDVVSRQLFRSNSSILGRRKKNQRKLRKKKQAHERRMSESENSETEEREKYKITAPKNIDDEKHVENIKPILNRDKTVIPQNNNAVNEPKNEFKNDLIFDLDM